jgi:5-methylcytosine-specific restriction endonuclease McrA
VPRVARAHDRAADAGVRWTREAPVPLGSRPKIPIAVQVRVLYRDGWLCRWCHRPTIFPLAMKYLDEFVRQRKFRLPIAYYDSRYRRDAAPLLDHLACVIDHVEAYSRGGANTEDNLVVACNKCNARKNSRQQAAFLAENSSKPVKGKYGEPRHWDGLASLFVVLSRENVSRLTPSDRVWLRELEAHGAGVKAAELHSPADRGLASLAPGPRTSLERGDTSN